MDPSAAAHFNAQAQRLACHSKAQQLPRQFELKGTAIDAQAQRIGPQEGIQDNFHQSSKRPLV